MKLFLYDDKHDHVFGELDLGVVSPETNELIEKIISFLEENGITDRYKNIVLGQSYTRELDPETDEFFVSFK